MRVANVEDFKDTLEELMDSYVAMYKMACMFPKGSRDRAFYLGKVQAYEDAVARVGALIEGDGYDDKWYVQREADGVRSTKTRHSPDTGCWPAYMEALQNASEEVEDGEEGKE